MAWLEKREGDAWCVCVVEQRGRTVWERVSRGKRNAQGRVHLVAELATDSEAAATFDARITALLANGYTTIDPSAGVDARRPRSEAANPARQRPLKPGIDDFVRDLGKHLDALPARPHLRDVLRTFDASMRAPRAFHAKGFVCDRTVRDTARVVAKVKSVEDYWREIGFSATLDVPDDRETSQDFIDSEGGAWPAFLADFSEDVSWRTVEDLSCVQVELVDDEID